MRIATVPENPLEWLALALGEVPTPMCDVLIGPMLAKAVIAATSLHVFDALKGGPLTANQVSIQCGTDTDGTERLLRALAASKYIKQERSEYQLTQVSRKWLISGAKRSLHYAMLHRDIDMRFMDFASYVRSGEGRDFHAELEPSDWRIYHRGQADQARLIADELVASVRIPSRATQVLDLGGAHGLYSLAFCRKHSQLQAKVLDLAEPSRADTDVVLDPAWSRVTFEIADVRSALLPSDSIDVVLIASLIHHFDDKTNSHLFSRAAAALVSGGILVTLDLVRPAPTAEANQVTSLMDLYFGAASGSQLWPLDQIRAWQSAAGLRPQRAVSLRLLPDYKIQIARKP